MLAGQYAELLQQSIADFAFLDRSVSKSYVSPSTRDPASNPGLDSKNSLVELNARLKQAHIRARASDRRWKHLIRQCEAAEVTNCIDASTNIITDSDTDTYTNTNNCANFDYYDNTNTIAGNDNNTNTYNDDNTDSNTVHNNDFAY